MKKREKMYLYLSKVVTAVQRLRALPLMFLVGLLPSSVVAQNTISKVSDALDGQVSELSRLGNTIVSIIQIISGILAVVALVTLVVKFQEGDHEAKKKLTFWVGGLVILFLALSIVKQLFNIGN